MSKLIRLALVPLLLAAVIVPAQAKDTPAIPSEHVAPIAAYSGSHRLHFSDQLLSGKKLQTSLHHAAPGIGGAAPMNASAGVQPFLTRPYWNWHQVISVFDHCNPDYSLDGKICEVDGTVAVSSNGSDPTFPPGYAITRGGTDYLYYDGHNGWDIGLNYEPLIAACPGTVTTAGVDPNNSGFGETVVIDCGNGFSIRYGHMSQITVSVGQHVMRSQGIGTSGNTGYSTGPHLHFGVYVNNPWTAIDPWGWAGTYGDPWPADAGNLWLTGNPQNPTPLAPGTPFAASVGNAVQVSWAPPSFDGGDPITSYTVIASPGGLRTTVPGNVTTATVRGLGAGVAYTFTVIAATDIATSPASNASNPATPHIVNPLGGQWSSLPSVTEWAPGSANMFVVGNDHSVWHNWSYQSSWHSWESLGGYLTSAAGSVQTQHTLFVFARGRDNAIWYRAWNGSNWSGWYGLGGSVTSDPTAVTWGADDVNLFVRGRDNAVWMRTFDGTSWAGWFRVGGATWGSIHVTTFGPGTLDVFVQGTDMAPWHTSYANGSWSGWSSLGGRFSSEPAPVVYTTGQIEVFARGTDGALWHSWMIGSAWSGWQSLGGRLNSGPVATVDANFHGDVFALGADNDVWHVGHVKWGGWQGWTALGGAWTGTFTASTVGAGQSDVVGVWPDSTIGEVDYTY